MPRTASYRPHEPTRQQRWLYRRRLRSRFLGKSRGLEPLHFLLDGLCGGQGVGPWQLEHRHGHAWFAIQGAADIVIAGTQFGSGHISQSNQFRTSALDDDLVELLRFEQSAAFGINRELEFLAIQCGPWPIRPAATWAFCSRSEFRTSPAVRFLPPVFVGPAKPASNNRGRPTSTRRQHRRSA